MNNYLINREFELGILFKGKNKLFSSWDIIEAYMNFYYPKKGSLNGTFPKKENDNKRI